MEWAAGGSTCAGCGRVRVRSTGLPAAAHPSRKFGVPCWFHMALCRAAALPPDPFCSACAMAVALVTQPHHHHNYHHHHHPQQVVPSGALFGGGLFGAGGGGDEEYVPLVSDKEMPQKRRLQLYQLFAFLVRGCGTKPGGGGACCLWSWQKGGDGMGGDEAGREGSAAHGGGAAVPCLAG